MSRSRIVGAVVVVFLAVAMTFIVQVKNYTNAIDTARQQALVDWAADDRERKLQLLSFQQHCSGDNIKQYPSIYACAEKHGAHSMLSVLEDSADSVSPPVLLFWLFG